MTRGKKTKTSVPKASEPKLPKEEPAVSSELSKPAASTQPSNGNPSFDPLGNSVSKSKIAPANSGNESSPIAPSSVSTDSKISPPQDSTAGEDTVMSDVTDGSNKNKAEAVGDGVKAEVVKVDPPEDSSGDVGDDVPFYPLPVKGPGGEEVELQVNPSDTAMDLRQFLSDLRETCFYTCYDLILKTKDDVRYHLVDFVEIGDITDISAGGCLLEMFSSFYDDRSVRFHIRKLRELLSPVGSFSSPSTDMTEKYELSIPLHSKTDPNVKNEPEEEKVLKDKKTEIPADLENLGFVDHTSGLLADLVLKDSHISTHNLEAISFSSLNPVPGFRRLQGDIMYLDITTSEGEKYFVTAHTRGFFVNSSSTNKLNYNPVQPKKESSTLGGLFRLLSPSFDENLKAVFTKRMSKHPFENMIVFLPPNQWLGTHPLPDHLADVARAEDALVSPFGSDVSGIQRDWNEEFQSCRDLPRSTLQERMLRDRALYRISSEFADAATKGAIAVISRSIPPLNAPDPDRFHMFVYNGIFYSLAVDADFLRLQQIREKELKELAEKEAPADEAKPKDEDSKSKVDGNGSAVKDPEEKEKEEKGQNVLEGEQATYSSSNNDLKGTRALNSSDVNGLYTLAMAIVDYRGHRVIAQSIIPGILHGDKTQSLLYGSVDNGKTIKWQEKFHDKVCEAAKFLHLKEHTVKDSEGSTFKLSASAESKGIIGSDDRYYLLDLMNITPRDSNFLDSEDKRCVLRHELVKSFCQHVQLEEYVKSQGLGEKPNEEEVVKLQEENKFVEVGFNPNILTDFQVGGDVEEIEKDEAFVRKAGSYLVDTVIPSLISDFTSLDVSPMDGKTLSNAFHNYGINMRYLGMMAEKAQDLPFIYQLCLEEMVVRSAKHILKAVLRETADHDVGGAIVHFMNCFFGTSTTVPPPPPVAGATSSILSSPAAATPDEKTKGLTETKDDGELKVDKKASKKGGKGAKKDKAKKKEKEGDTAESSTLKTQVSGATAAKAQEEKVLESADVNVGLSTDEKPGYTRINGEMVWSDIQAGVNFKYKFKLPEDIRAQTRKLPTLRNFCLKMGIVIAARDYTLESESPFLMDDIQDLQPVIKHAAHSSKDAETLLNKGKRALNQAKLNEAFENFNEAYYILQQVCGPMHPDVATCCRYLAMVLYHAGETAQAVLQQHRELIINERCLGIDHPDTAHSYGNIGLFYHAMNEPDLALRHMSRTLKIFGVTCGPSHPDAAATFINLAMTYQESGKMNVTLRYLQEALNCNQKLLGEDHIQTAVCYHALALAFSTMKNYKLAYQHERKAHTVLNNKLGKDDSRTRDSAQWMQSFQNREAQTHPHKGVETPTAQQAAAVLRVAEVLKERPELMAAFQAASGGRGGNANLSQRAAADAILRGAAAANELPRMAMPGVRPRGMDERAARAAAEARKKAVARGVNLRVPQSQPQQLSSPIGGPSDPATSNGLDLEELIRIINSTGAKAAAAASGSGPGTNSLSSGSSTTTTAALNSKPVPNAGSVTGLGAGLGVGLGAVSGTPPPTKAGGPRKMNQSMANGNMPGDTKAPVGLGVTLETASKKS